MKLFCLGFPKTGTTSIEMNFSQMGYRVCHGHWARENTNFLMHCWKTNDFNEIKRVINHYEVFADGPWGGTNLFRFLIDNYPEEKFILTEREPESWYESLKSMIETYPIEGQEVFTIKYFQGQYGFVNYMETFFEIPHWSNEFKDKILEKYLATNAEVKKQCDEKGINLLVLDTKELGNWDKICNHAGIEKQDINVVHGNPGQKKGQLSIEQALTLIQYYLSRGQNELALAWIGALKKQDIQSPVLNSLEKRYIVKTE